MGTTYAHNHGKEAVLFPSMTCYFNPTTANGPLRQVRRFPQSTQPTAYVADFDGYSWSFFPDGSKNGAVYFNNVAVADQAGTFADLMSRITVGANQNINTNPIYYAICETVMIEDPILTVLCKFNATDPAQYNIYSTNAIKDNLYFTDIDGTRYWMSITKATGHRSLTINGVQTSDEAKKDAFFARVSKGDFVNTVSNGEGIHYQHAMCAKYYSASS